MPSALDILFILIFLAAVTAVIGLNIITFIDRKISNVAVNIPPTNITLNILEDEKGKIKICPSSSPLAHPTNIKTEHFTTAEAWDNNKYEQHREAALAEVPDIIDPMPIKTQDDFYLGPHDYSSSRIAHPPGREYLNQSDFETDAPVPVASCANSSVANKWRSGEKRLLPNQINCNKPNKLTAENYYHTMYKTQVVPMEDYLVRGANYSEYVSFVKPTEIDYRILSQATKGLPEKEDRYKNMPDPSNYAAHNTPAMRMP